MAENLLILGAGQYGAVAKETAQAMGCFDMISFLDDNSALAIGNLANYESFIRDYRYAFVAIGNPALRAEWIYRLEEKGFGLPVLKHPQATVMPSAQIAGGSIIEGQALVNSNATIAAGCFISAGAVVNHNAQLGACCHIDCNAVVSAGGTVPAQTKVPSGTVFH
ncbi:MAG: hypothetical protein IJ407_00665 [Clostridia bacterium]|nr:hypothetical protein [Clostridia bacterium]